MNMCVFCVLYSCLDSPELEQVFSQSPIVPMGDSSSLSEGCPVVFLELPRASKTLALTRTGVFLVVFLDLILPFKSGNCSPALLLGSVFALILGVHVEFTFNTHEQKPSAY